MTDGETWRGTGCGPEPLRATVLIRRGTGLEVQTWLRPHAHSVLV